MSRIAIVCVDDQQIILESLSMQLERYYGAGFLLEFANSGQTALEIVDSLYKNGVEYVVVVCDLSLGFIRGDELLSIIHSRYPQAGKILLSGYMPHELIKKLESKVNLNGYVYKPWDIQELIKAIDSAICYIVGSDQDVFLQFPDINRTAVLCVSLDTQWLEKVGEYLGDRPFDFEIYPDFDQAMTGVDVLAADGVRHLVVVADCSVGESEFIIDAQSQFVSVKLISLNGGEHRVAIDNQVKGVNLAGKLEFTHSVETAGEIICSAVNNCLVCV